MPRATLIFELPEERSEFILTTQAGDWYSVVYNMEQWLRKQIKYHDKEHLQEARNELNELIRERKLDLYE